MKELWKIIENFEAYEVSNLGRVRRRLPGVRTYVGRLLKPSPDTKGYLQVVLFKSKKGTTKKIHKLVAKAFIPNPKNLLQVNHIGKKTDNRACKLEWISTKEHGRDVSKRNQRGDGVNFHRRMNKWAACYNPEPKTRKHIGYFNTFKEAKAARDEKLKTL